MLIPTHYAEFAIGCQAAVNTRPLFRAHVVLHHAPAFCVIETFDNKGRLAQNRLNVQSGQLDRKILKLQIVKVQELHLQGSGLVLADHLFHEPLGSQVLSFHTIKVDDRQFVLEITCKEKRVRAKRTTATKENLHRFRTLGGTSSVGASKRKSVTFRHAYNAQRSHALTTLSPNGTFGRTTNRGWSPWKRS